MSEGIPVPPQWHTGFEPRFFFISGSDMEMDALKICTEALEDIPSPTGRQRVANYLKERYAVESGLDN